MKIERPAGQKHEKYIKVSFAPNKGLSFERNSALLQMHRWRSGTQKHSRSFYQLIIQFANVKRSKAVHLNVRAQSS